LNRKQKNKIRENLKQNESPSKLLSPPKLLITNRHDTPGNNLQPDEDLYNYKTRSQCFPHVPHFNNYERTEWMLISLIRKTIEYENYPSE
jgi:hypothetical protein